jgi:rhodanese-related sulfurtransferase
MVYINPTFIWSAIVGGLIMGAGFIIGGFCPGTSLAAAAIGKIDAWAFVAGSFIGILAFAEGYPHIENLYLSGNMGEITIFEFMDVPRDLFAVILALVAVTAFFATGIIEDRVNGLPSSYPSRKVVRYFSLATLPFLFIALVSFTPDRNEFLMKKAEKLYAEDKPAKIYPMDKLVAEIIERHHAINLIDVRSPIEYSELSMPLAMNIPLDSIFDPVFSNIFNQRHKINIFLANNKKDATIAFLLASMLGRSENFLLDISPEQFKRMYLEPEIPSLESSKEEKDLFRYRLKAGMELKAMDEKLKSRKEPEKKTSNRVKGGC